MARALLLLAIAWAPSACGNDEEREDARSAAPPPDPKFVQGPDGRKWRKLEHDGLHDTANEFLPYLQEPVEALSLLPPGGPEGNKVDWVAALAEGVINPRTNVYPETKVRVLDLDIVFTETAGEPHVVFPHRQHTEWLDCANCHPIIFEAKKGANDIGMLDVLQGEYCGRCHGAVSFPLTQCDRCHSLDWQREVAN